MVDFVVLFVRLYLEQYRTFMYWMEAQYKAIWGTRPWRGHQTPTTSCILADDERGRRWKESRLASSYSGCAYGTKTRVRRRHTTAASCGGPRRQLTVHTGNTSFAAAVWPDRSKPPLRWLPSVGSWSVGCGARGTN